MGLGLALRMAAHCSQLIAPCSALASSVCCLLSVDCRPQLTMQNRGLARASQTCLNLAERKRFRGRKNIGPDIREFFGRRTRRGVNPSFLTQRYNRYFCRFRLLASLGFFFLQVIDCDEGKIFSRLVEKTFSAAREQHAEPSGISPRGEGRGVTV